MEMVESCWRKGDDNTVVGWEELRVRSYCRVRTVRQCKKLLDIHRIKKRDR